MSDARPWRWAPSQAKPADATERPRLQPAVVCGEARENAKLTDAKVAIFAADTRKRSPERCSQLPSGSPHGSSTPSSPGSGGHTSPTSMRPAIGFTGRARALLPHAVQSDPNHPWRRAQEANLPADITALIYHADGLELVTVTRSVWRPFTAELGDITAASRARRRAAARRRWAV